MPSASERDTLPKPSANADAGEGSPGIRERQLIWKQNSSGAIADYNAMIGSIGVPLAQFRKF